MVLILLPLCVVLAVWAFVAYHRAATASKDGGE